MATSGQSPTEGRGPQIPIEVDWRWRAARSRRMRCWLDYPQIAQLHSIDQRKSSRAFNAASFRQRVNARSRSSPSHWNDRGKLEGEAGATRGSPVVPAALASWKRLPPVAQEHQPSFGLRVRRSRITKNGCPFRDPVRVGASIMSRSMASHPQSCTKELPHEGRELTNRVRKTWRIMRHRRDYVDLNKGVAERVGFEPTMGCPIPHFECGAFVRSAISP